MNMASLWKLPVLFVCENNLYGIGTAISRSTAVVDQWERVEAYNIPSAHADGQDVEAVHAAASAAVEHVRSTRTPYFLELKTYRFRGHSMSDSGAYRSKEEEEEWKRRDPIVLLKQKMLGDGQIREEDYRALDREILQRIEKEIVGFAESSPAPDLADLERYVFVEGDPWVNGGGASR